MPKIFEYFGFIFFFYSNEHEPIHVHVLYGETQSVFDLILDDGILQDLMMRNVGGYAGLSQKNAKIADAFIRKYALEIVGKWVDYFVMKKKVECVEITKRI